ncbi:MAG TPA: N-acetylmuramoyl-L-alanine amidase-like domain-containing protein [Bacteroidota bacterium]
MNRRAFLRTFPALSSLSLVPWDLIAARPYGDNILQSGDPDALLCARKFELAVSLSLQKKPIGTVITEVGKSFIGTEYLANGIEAPGEERLVVNMRGLDCVSFCENAVVLARCIKKNAMSFDEYKRELQFLRYRGGVIEGYPSRLHYFTDYIYDGEKKGIWRDVTKTSGESYRKKMNFMSTHPNAYQQLKEHPELVQVIAQQEEEISKREMYYIPKGSVHAIEHEIHDGDILAITTDIEGLDVSHTAIAIRQSDRLHMMHAPDVGYKVMITELPLAEYLAKNKRQTGIIVARAVEPV